MTKYKTEIFKIPFNKPHLTNKELDYISKAYNIGQLSGDGYFTELSSGWIKNELGCKHVLLTNSGTASLDMMGILAGIKKGDEIIMPSFTFVSTANAFVLRGATPVFVDIRKDTLNIDEGLIEEAITRKTKAIVVVHYAGVGCEMDTIKKIAMKNKLLLIEDAAQAFLAEYNSKYLGTFGDLSAFSFHETKNIISGEGGALIINNEKYTERAEIIREKGTDRSKFLRGEVDKYTWVDIGSSYLPGEMTAAFLYAQLKEAKKINKKRLGIWYKYQKSFVQLESAGKIRRPIIPNECKHNGHLYYLLVDNIDTRTRLIRFLKKKGILSVFHYIPLHSSPAGKKFSRKVGGLEVTKFISERLIRLPLYYDLGEKEQDYIISSVYSFFR